MRILYINKTLSGTMGPVARFLAQDKATSSVFVAERWPRDTSLPGCMLVRIPTVAMPASTHSESTVEAMMLRSVRNAANVKAACTRLRQSGFSPDVMYVTAQDGYAQDVRDVYPDARMVARSDWFYPPRSSFYERMYNTLQLTLFKECTAGITSSHWQKQQMDESVERKIHVINNGVDTRFFTPPPPEPDLEDSTHQEIITFSCQGTNPARSIYMINECLPALLTLRPQCRIYIVSFAARRSDGVKMQHMSALSALLPPLTEQQRQRVRIVVSPPPAHYLALLQQSTLYVYLTTPTLISAGLMEAMSCGTLVLASATAPVCEIVNNGENGLLWEGNDAQGLAFAVAETCSKAKNLQSLRRNARETILARHDMRVLLPRHAATVLEA